MIPAALAILGAAADTWTTLRGVRRGLREGNPLGVRAGLAAKWIAVAGAVWYGDPVLLGVLAILYLGAAAWNVWLLRRAGLLALALLAAPSALGQEPPWPDPCIRAEACRMVWDAVANGAQPLWYDVIDADTGEVCARISGRTGPKGRWQEPVPQVWPVRFPALPSEACFARESVGYHYAVRACDADGCALPSNVATFIGQLVACLGPGCERPCWPGAPLRLPHLPLCPDGTP